MKVPLYLLLCTASLCIGCEPPSAEPDESFELGEDIDLHDWCTSGIGPELFSFEHEGAAWMMGPCGHLVGTGDSPILIHPDDGEHEPLSGTVSGPQFSPTGHLLAWTGASQIQLRDLDARRTLSISAPVDAWLGFVLSSNPEIGARLWTCADELRTWNLDGDGHNLGAALCHRLVASSGSPMLAFADANAIRLANADTGEVLTVAHGFHDEPVTDGGDRVWVDHDGRVVIHHIYDWRSDGGHVEYHQEVAARIYTADGTSLASYDSFAWPLQARRRGAPVFLVMPSHGVSVVFDNHGVLELAELPIQGLVYDHWLADEGSLMVLVSQFQLQLYTPEHPTIPMEIGPFGDARASNISPDGQTVYTFDETDQCVTDSCDSNQNYFTLFAWTPDEGVREVLTQTLGGVIRAISNEGLALIYTSLTGPIEGEPGPELHTFIVSLDGEVRGDLGLVRLEAIGWIFADRLVVRVWTDDGVSDLGLVDFDAGTLELLAADFGGAPVQFDGLGERVAFASGALMSWGRVP